MSRSKTGTKIRLPDSLPIPIEDVPTAYQNRVNSNNINATIFKFYEKFDHPFSQVFIFGNMFPESHGSLLCRLQAVSKIHVSIYPYLISGLVNCSTM